MNLLSTNVKLADRLFLTAESTETPQHVAALGVFSPPEDARHDFVAALADRFRAVRGFQPPFNYRLRHPRLRAVAPRGKRSQTTTSTSTSTSGTARCRARAASGSSASSSAACTPARWTRRSRSGSCT